MEFIVYLFVLILCEAALAGISNQTNSSSEPQQQASNTDSSTPMSTLSTERDERLERSKILRLIALRQHVLDTLGWDEPPEIDPETKRRLHGGRVTPVYETRQECFSPACDLPAVDLPDYVNRTVRFDTSSTNIRLYFDMQANTDPDHQVTTAIMKLHLKRREDCPCAVEEDDPTSRIHIEIYQYSRPIRSLSRFRHNTKRLVDARIVTWNGPRWTTFSVTEAVRRIIMSDRRIGGFEVIVRDSEENIIDANAVIDPTECTSMNSFDCSEADQEEITLDEQEETHETNFSPILSVSYNN